jgi:hypothetical protein
VYNSHVFLHYISIFPCLFLHNLSYIQTRQRKYIQIFKQIPARSTSKGVLLEVEHCNSVAMQISKKISKLMMVLKVWICKCSLCYGIYVMAHTLFITILKSCVINHIKAELTPVFWRCAVHDCGKCWEWPWVCKRNRDFFVYVLSGSVRGTEMPLPYGCTVWCIGLKLNISYSHFRSGSLFLNLENSLLFTKYISCLIWKLFLNCSPCVECNLWEKL